MAFDTSASDFADNALQVGPWVTSLPDGAVSVSAEGDSLVLRASDALQREYERLLERRKSGTLTPGEERKYQAICELDDALSWLNRLARNPKSQS